MNFLYMDNYRGFQDTLMPIKDVNFLVGENSTGKTSVMSLIYILSSLRFWMSSTNFDTPEKKLGNYNDIVSAHSKDKRCFRVGMCLYGEKKSHTIYLVTFKEREGMPLVSRYTYETENKLMDVVYGPNSIKYKIEKKSDIFNQEIDRARDWFHTWRDRHEESVSSYTNIKYPAKLGLMRSLGALNAYLLEEQKDKKESGKTISITVSLPYRDVTWLAPIRTKPKRTYDEYSLEFSPEGEHTPYLIKKYFRKKKEKVKFVEYVRKFGVNSGLFKTIELKNFGRTTTAPFELDVGLDGTMLKIIDVGYGVSQALPVVVELFEKFTGSCYMIQQPEIHLHPRAQAAMGELFYDLNVNEDKDFMIETHSDFIIDRFRVKMRSSKKKSKAQVLYFTRDRKGNGVYSIEILKNGDFTDKQPRGYREFFVREQMNVLGL